MENDRLNHMNIPQPIPPLPLPHHQHYQPQINNHPPIPNRPPRDYNDELARRRLQELRDEAIARRLQTLGMDDDDDERIVQVGDGPQNHQYMNREYVLAAADLLTGPYANAQAAANRLPPRPQPQPPPPNDRAREERGAHLLHQHTAESNLYNNNTPHRRASERVVPRRQHTDYATEYERHQPLEGRTDRRRSEMAGLVSERGGGRVGNWLEFVEDG